MGLRGQIPKNHAGQRREVSHNCPIAIFVMGHEGQLWDKRVLLTVSEPMVHFVRAPFLAKKGVTLGHKLMEANNA